jgi:hypothetical protein
MNIVHALSDLILIKKRVSVTGGDTWEGYGWEYGKMVYGGKKGGGVRGVENGQWGEGISFLQIHDRLFN